MMDSPPSLETVYQAVTTLYHNQNCTEKEKASQWLGELQRSIYSWKIADEMLQQKRDLESCYFAAQTMRTKIQYSFAELPSEVHNSLRDSIIQHLEQVNDSTNSVIVTQLCLALAALSLQMSSWQKPVLDLISRFGERHIWPLLEIMTVLPEEVNSKSLRLGANRRHQILEELSSCSGTVCEFLKVCLTNTDNPQIHVKVLRCFTSWVMVQAISLNGVTDSLIVLHAFQILSNHQSSAQLHDAATECVCSLLQSLEDNNNQQALEQQLFSGVVALEESYLMSVAHEDQDKSMNYCRIFTELGESFLEKIVSSSFVNNENHFALKVLDLVLICVGHHDYEVAEITFNLWYRLSEDLYQRNDDALTLKFKPYVERLIESLCRHSRMEPDHEGLLDDVDDFADFRNKVSELIKDVVFIVGSSNCFRQMFLSLQSSDVTWDKTEAALFVMQAVAKNIIPEESEVVPQVVKAILALEPESSHIAVRHTSVLLLGELCEWIERHSEETLNPVLCFLLFCLKQPQLASASANALQLICTACRDKMAQHFNVLALQIVEALNSSSISSDAAIGLLKGVSVILAKMPADEIYSAMKSLCWVQVEPLRKLNESDIKTEKGTKTDPVLWLDRLAAIFRHTNPMVANGSVNPCAAVFTEMWPVLSETCNKYQSDLRVMERCCRCLRFAVRCVGRQSSHLLHSIVGQIVSLYSMYKHSCFLYLGSILVDEYACESQCVACLLEMLQAFIQPTFEILQEENGLKNHPDTVDDFFRLCARFLQRIPVEFLRCPALPAILECALLACSLDHRDANASIMKFFYDLILCGRNHKDKSDIELRKQLVSSIVASHGKRLVNNLIEASVFSLHSYMLTGVADVLMELLDHDRNAVSQWLQEALNSLPTHNSMENWSKYKKFGQISGVSVDTFGNVFVFHRGDRTWGPNTFTMDNKFKDPNQGPIKQSTIIVLHPETGELITQTGANMFFLPHGLTVDHENNIWITDVAMHQVFKFSPINLKSNTTNLGQPGLVLGTAFEPGSRENQFCKPTDVVIDRENGDFFVSDGYCNSRILKYDKSGTKLLEWGRAARPNAPVGPYDFFLPHALSLAQERKLLFVADRENKRVVAYNSNNGDFFKEYATDMLSPIYSVFFCPYHGGLLHALSNQPAMIGIPGNLYPGFPAPAPNRVSVYEVDSGKTLFQYYPPQYFQNAHDIALNRNGNASYVVDLSHNIWKFDIEFHEAPIKKAIDKSTPENNNTIQIVPTRLKEEDLWGGTNIAIALVTFTIVIALLVFLFHIQKRRGAYRRSEMRGLILDDDEDEGINLS